MWNPVTGTPIAAIFEAGGAPLVKFVGTGKYARIMHDLAATHPGKAVQLLDDSRGGSVLLLDNQSGRNPGLIALYTPADGKTMPLFRMLPSIDPAAMPHRAPWSASATAPAWRCKVSRRSRTECRSKTCRWC